MESPFTLEILGNSHFRLRRKGEELHRVFSSVKDVLDYVRKVSDDEAEEIHFERRWSDHRALFGGTGDHSLLVETSVSTVEARTPDYEFLK